MKILIVDDDRDLTDLLGFVLQRAAFRVVAARDPTTALELLEVERPALVLLDARLGNSNGFDLLREIRRSNHVPVIMLTAMNREDDKVLAFQLGADDYVTKPFSHRELVVRIRARLKGPGTASATGDTSSAQLHFGSLDVNAQDYTAAKEGHALKLTATEFRLLHCLLTQAGSVVPTASILKQVWGYDDPSVRDSLRVAVYRLRRKIEDDPKNPRLLQTVPGVGFLLRSDADEVPASPESSSRGQQTGPDNQEAATTLNPLGEGPRRKRPGRISIRTRPHLRKADSSSLERRLGR